MITILELIRVTFNHDLKAVIYMYIIYRETEVLLDTIVKVQKQYVRCM